MPRANVNGMRLNYKLSGPEDAPVLMFSNSLGTSFGMWDPQVSAFSANWRILQYDTRGHGASEVTEAPYTVDLLASDAVALLDHLEIARVHFCGLSLGGLTGQALALQWPERLVSLTLTNTAAHIPPVSLWNERIAAVRARGLEPIVDGVLARWFTAGFAKRAPDAWSRMRTMFCANDPRGYVACCMAVRDSDFRQDLARVRVPTLVIFGEDDQATPPAFAEFLAGAIPGARLIGIEKAAHISNVEQPEIFNGHLRRFLTDVAALAETRR